MESGGGHSTKRKATQQTKQSAGASTRSKTTSQRQKELLEEEGWLSTMQEDSEPGQCSTAATALLEALTALTKSVDSLREHLGGEEDSEDEAEEVEVEDSSEEEKEDEGPGPAKPARKCNEHRSGWFLQAQTASGSRPTLWGAGRPGSQQEMED